MDSLDADLRRGRLCVVLDSCFFFSSSFKCPDPDFYIDDQGGLITVTSCCEMHSSVGEG